MSLDLIPSRSPDFWKSRLHTRFQVVITGRKSTEEQAVHLIWGKWPDANLCITFAGLKEVE